MSEIDPWVRADMQQYNPETFALIPDIYKPDYVRIMHNLVQTAADLVDAQVAFAKATEERDHFFEWVIHE